MEYMHRKKQTCAYKQAFTVPIYLKILIENWNLNIIENYVFDILFNLLVKT